MIEVSGKVKWQSRRGMRELDLMLLPFVEHDLPKGDERQLAAYCKLLEHTDLELVRWLNGTAVPEDPELIEIIACIRRCHEGRRGREGV
ncbi:MAG: succinate dehydrogenase assembly factor 2 [Succinivibrio sp.]|nr:succinate dehydrogenase assembly factor 2 [Succinivibrio sp.]